MLYDKDIREPLFEFLEDRYGKVRLLEEQVMGQSRADIVMVKGSLRNRDQKRCGYLRPVGAAGPGL